MISGVRATDPGRLARLACGIASFALPVATYVASASHEPGSWDTAELQGVPYLLGITHPTGFPLYVLIGYVWSHLLPIGSVAFRMNAMSAVAMGVAGTAAYATAVRLGAWRPLALCATLWYAVAPDIWSHANRAEAQDLAVACEALAIYLFVRWMQGGKDARLYGAGALLGLGVAAHPNALWITAGFAAGIAVVRPRPPLRRIAAFAAFAAAGLLLYAYLPLRSSYVVAHGLDPTAALPGTSGGIFWNYNDPSTLHGLLRTLSGTESNAPAYFLAAFNPLHVQRAFGVLVTGIVEQFGAFALVLAAFGAASLFKRDWRTALVLVLSCATALMFSATYGGEADIGRYRLMAFWLEVPLFAAALPGRPRDFRSAMLRYGFCLAFLVEAATSLYAQRGQFARNAGEGGRWVIDAVRPAVPPGSVVIVDDWLDATSLAYGAYVDRSLPDRTIVSGWDPGMSGWYRQWARKRPVFLLADPHAVGAIAGTDPPLRLDDYHVLLRVVP